MLYRILKNLVVLLQHLISNSYKKITTHIFKTLQKLNYNLFLKYTFTRVY